MPLRRFGFFRKMLDFAGLWWCPYHLTNVNGPGSSYIIMASNGNLLGNTHKLVMSVQLYCRASSHGVPLFIVLSSPFTLDYRVVDRNQDAQLGGRLTLSSAPYSKDCS